MLAHVDVLASQRGEAHRMKLRCGTHEPSSASHSAVAITVFPTPDGPAKSMRSGGANMLFFFASPHDGSACRDGAFAEPPRDD